MALFEFSVESNAAKPRSVAWDLPDPSMARLSAKYIARDLAAQDMLSGIVRQSGFLTIRDEHGAEVDRMPMRSIIDVV